MNTILILLGGLIAVIVGVAVIVGAVVLAVVLINKSKNKKSE